ncbi:MAG: hypothetical protein M3401_07535, partial [Actinomycetota bacterium]|nr:hypothetical protein [Actinomycetota bacterium]
MVGFVTALHRWARAAGADIGIEEYCAVLLARIRQHPEHRIVRRLARERSVAIDELWRLPSLSRTGPTPRPALFLHAFSDGDYSEAMGSPSYRNLCAL